MKRPAKKARIEKYINENKSPAAVEGRQDQPKKKISNPGK